MQDYFENPGSRPLGALISNLIMALIGIGGIIAAHQILTGWIAIGARTNISRRSLSLTEIGIALVALLVAAVALRTAWAIYTRERAGWAWTQWASLLSLFIGFVLGMGAVLGASDGSAINMTALILGAVIFVASAGVYRYSTTGAAITPEQYFRIQLADSPSAGAIIGFVAIFLGFSMASELFLSSTSIASILTNNATKGIIAIGITILMISGEFDLSVGSVLGVISMVFMLAMTEGFLFLGPQPVVIAAVIALVVALLMGFINGIVFVLTGIPSFIVTLGTLFAYRAISLVVIADGRILRYRDYYTDFPVVSFSRWIVAAGALLLLGAVLFVAYRALPAMWHEFNRRWSNRHDNGDFGTTSALFSGLRFVVVLVVVAAIVLWGVMAIGYQVKYSDSSLTVGTFDLLNGRVIGATRLDDGGAALRGTYLFDEVTGGRFSIYIPGDANIRTSILWWFIMVAIFQTILMNTRYGNAVFAVGGNIGAARAQGINASRVKIQNFMLCSFMAGVAAIFEVARNPGVDPLKGNTWELEVIAMTVIGGALLTGGYGSIIGTMLGVMIFGMLQTGLVLVGMDSRMFQGVIGVIMIIAVVLNNITKRTR